MDDVTSGYNPLPWASKPEVCQTHLWRILREMLLYSMSHSFAASVFQVGNCISIWYSLFFFLSEKSFGILLNYSKEEAERKEDFQIWLQSSKSFEPECLPNLGLPAALFCLSWIPSIYDFRATCQYSKQERLQQEGKLDMNVSVSLPVNGQWKLMQLYVKQAEDTNQREAAWCSRKPLECELGNGF